MEPCFFNILLLCRSVLASSSVFHKKSIFDYGNLDQTIAHNNLIVLITLYPFKKTQQTYTHPPPLTHVLTRKREFKGPFFCTYPCYMLKLRCSCLFNYNSCDGTIKSSQKVIKKKDNYRNSDDIIMECTILRSWQDIHYDIMPC